MLEELFDPAEPLWTALGSVAPWELLLDAPAVVAALSARGRMTDGPEPVIHPSAVVTGSYLGPGVHVYEGCTVRDSVVLAGTTIGHASEVARSVILPDCMIPRFNYVGSSLLGRGVNLGGSTQLASMRYDRAPVRLCLPSGEVETDREKFGSLLGDGARVAYGCHVNPGSVIGRGALIGPHIDWRGYCPPEASVFLRQRTFMSRGRGADMFQRGE
ncbi:hypothetical protein GCM10022254_16550 [Actinomadura meridiana]|uniref:Glucose-1-phosphate adenylyltransferase/Bifunctional protein GlmU-like C-terminal hexapeptide domain-containing protein n=1 Tax=Actinomadura meridiana TaxID=559626 RepID=A0ABP8BVS7_9ACTN